MPHKRHARYRAGERTDVRPTVAAPERLEQRLALATLLDYATDTTADVGALAEAGNVWAAAGFSGPEPTRVAAAFLRAAELGGFTAPEIDSATEWVVRLVSGVDPANVALTAGATASRATGILADTHIWTFPEATAGASGRRLGTAQRPRSVVAAYPLVAREQAKRLIPNDPLFANQWHLLNTGQGGGTAGEDANITGVWEAYLGTGVLIAIVDDGLQRAHPDLVARYVAAASYDFNGNDSDPTPAGNDAHGTAAAGVAAGSGNNALGISGAAPGASLAGLRLIAAPANDAQEASALTFALSTVDIYSNSWGPSDTGRVDGPGPLTLAALEQGVTNGRDGLGAIYVWSAGNGLQSDDNVNYDGYANSRYTIAVTAIDNTGRQSWYAEPGAPILVAAHSSGSTLEITTTDLVGTAGYNTASSGAGGDYTNTFGGTSSAAPLVSGVVALMLEANPELTWRDVQHVLLDSARRNDPSDADWTQNGSGRWVNHKYGYGAVDAEAAVALAETWTPATPEVKAPSGTRFVSQAIPDNNTTGITSTFTMSADLTTEWVEVTFAATHPYRGDLEVVLTSPSGTQSVLAEPRGDSGQNYSNWTFTSARHWGESSAGDWTLTVRDLVSADLGNWASWSLDVYGTEPVVVEPPTLAITADTAGSVVAGGSATISFTVNQPVSGFTLDDVAVTGGGLSNFSGSGNAFTATFTPRPGFEGTATISVPAAAFTNASNLGNPAAELSFSVDAARPSVTISRPGSGQLAAGQTAVITFAISEPVTNFAVGDISVVGGSLSGFAGAGSIYTALFTPAAGYQGTATITVAAAVFTDPGGNGTPGALLIIPVDTLAPTLVISRPGSSPLAAGQTTTITFAISEAVTNFTAADIGVVGGSLSGFAGTGSIYTALFTPAVGYQGTATIAVAAAVFTDAVGNGTSGALLTIPVDTLAPTLAISRPGNSPLAAGQTTVITFIISEPVTNFTAGDIGVVGGSLSRFAGAGSSYTALFTPAAGYEGTATITVAAAAFTDAVGNGTPGALLTIPVDTLAPTLVISRPGSSPLAAGQTTIITFAISEAVTNFAAGGIGIVGGSLSGFAGAGNIYTALFTPAAGYEGTATITVAAAAFTDAVGNSTSGALLTIPVDTLAPTLVIVRLGSGQLAAGQSTVITFAISERVTNFTAGDIGVVGGSLSRFAGAGSSYTALFTPAAGYEGTATIMVVAGAFTDGVAQPNIAAMLSIPVDTLAPVVMLAGLGESPLIAGSTATVVITLSEPVTNFGLGSLFVGGGSLSALTGSGTTYQAVFQPAPDFRGTAMISLPAFSVTDPAGNGNAAAAGISFNVDTVIPTILRLSSPAAGLTLGISAAAPIIVEFSERVQPIGAVLTIGLNTGVSLPVVVDPDGLTARGLYTVQPGEVADSLEVTVIVDTGGLRSAAGNRLSAGLPLPGFGLSDGPLIVIDGVVKFVGNGQFSTDPTLIRDLRNLPRPVSIRFTTPVTGVTVGSFQLHVDGREVPLRAARLVGSGVSYALFIPVTRIRPAGLYSLAIRPDALIRAVANGAAATTTVSLHWGNHSSIGFLPDMPVVTPTAISPPTGRTAVQLAWRVPSGNAGGPVSSYVVEYRPVGSTRWIQLRLPMAASSAPALTVTRLAASRVYEFRAAARNAAGLGSFSIPVRG